MSKKVREDYTLGLEGKLDMVRKSIRAVTRGYTVARMISGCLDENTELILLVDDEIYNKIIINREKKQAFKALDFNISIGDYIKI